MKMYLKPITIALAALAVGSTAPACAATIDFSSLQGDNLSAFTSYSQSGFTVAKTAGDVFVANYFGNPVPDITFNPGSAVDVTGGLFSFSSFDLGNPQDDTISVTGFLSGLQTYSNTFSNFARGTFATQMSGTGQQLFDKLTFSFAGPDRFGVNVDNINVTANAISAVPESATWAMMILGMGAIGFAMRRRQKVSTRVKFA